MVAGNSRREAEQNLNSHFAQPSVKTLSFQAGQELLEKIEKLMDLMAHKNFDRDLGRMVEILVDQKLSRYEKRSTPKNILSAIPETEIDQTSNKSVPSRSIPRKVKSLVWAKQQGKCSFKDFLTGRTCDSTHGIQIDHRHPISKGGANDLQNLTLLCASHNKWKGSRILLTPPE